MLRFGNFQLKSLILIILGMTSGSYIILPLSFLELMPDFKCEYEDSKLETGVTYWQ